MLAETLAALTSATGHSAPLLKQAAVVSAAVAAAELVAAAAAAAELDAVAAAEPAAAEWGLPCQQESRWPL